MIVVEQIKAARAMLDLSQLALAKKAGISIATLNNIERGVQTDPKISTLRAIQRALEAEGIEFTRDANDIVGILLKLQSRNVNEALILIIDDNNADRTLYKSWLSKAPGKKYTIVEAADGKQGYEAFLQHNPQCIILDFMMYGIDGFQLLVEMKREHAKIPPIVFVTGMHSDTLKRDVKAQGVHAYLEKDKITKEVLCKAVEKALG